jgi:hypothetical protein
MARNRKNHFLCPFLVVLVAVNSFMKLVDALAMINATRNKLPQPFTIEHYTLNRKNQTGGELKKAENHIGAGSNHDAMQNGTITIKPIFGEGHPTTVHIRLIKSLNGKRVFW